MGADTENLIGKIRTMGYTLGTELKSLKEVNKS